MDNVLILSIQKVTIALWLGRYKLLYFLISNITQFSYLTKLFLEWNKQFPFLTRSRACPFIALFGGHYETRFTLTINLVCPSNSFNNAIQNNLNHLWGIIGYDINNFGQNSGGGNGSGSGNNSNPNPTYQSSFVDPNVLYSGSLPASLLSQDEANAQYNYYLSEYTRNGYFSEGEFSMLYWAETDLFKQIDGFLSVSKPFSNKFL